LENVVDPQPVKPDNAGRSVLNSLHIYVEL